MYLVGADVFIQARTGTTPSTWFRDSGSGCSSRDELARWVMDRDETFFLPPGDEVVASLRVASEWATNCDRFTPTAVADFLAKADYYLVSHAHAHADVVVTHEVSSNSPNKMKIPDACSDLRVECITPFAMLREAGARFVRA